LTEPEKRLGWFERPQDKFLSKVRESPEKEARLRKSWFGRMMLETAERAVDGAGQLSWARQAFDH